MSLYQLPKNLEGLKHDLKRFQEEMIQMLEQKRHDDVFYLESKIDRLQLELITLRRQSRNLNN